MANSYLETLPLRQFDAFAATHRRVPYSFELEVTYRCNNACRHCYACLPREDEFARKNELSVNEIDRISSETLEMGALWCTLTGGEPLLREDFEEIYLLLVRKGLLVSVFSNGCLITERIVRLLKKHPPRDFEITVYGITQETYAAVTRNKGDAFESFGTALQRLQDAGVPFRLKSMVMRSNVHEATAIKEYAEYRTKDYFRFDYQLHLRYDRDEEKNRRIREERILPPEVPAVELLDSRRRHGSRKACLSARGDRTDNNLLLRCSAGDVSFCVDPYGRFKLCDALVHPDFTYDLRHGTLKEAWDEFVPHVKRVVASKGSRSSSCWDCSILPLCAWCPAKAYLETGTLESRPDHFCRLAHARARAHGVELPMHPANNLPEKGPHAHAAQ